MRIWLSLIAVSLLSWLIKASGPLVLGSRELPPVAVRVAAYPAPALLAGLIVTELVGEDWQGIDAYQIAGVTAAGAARMLKAPMLVAVGIGAVVAAVLRVA
jgi:branched-subunit amino acid transport protein